MHTIIEDQCTGCDLCIPVCPVDCIHTEVVTPGRSGWSAWSPELAADARRRYEERQRRQARLHAQHASGQLTKAEDKLANLEAHSQHDDAEVLARKRALVQAAIDRARFKARAASGEGPKP
jgi:electron transport complex protein RnfB